MEVDKREDSPKDDKLLTDEQLSKASKEQLEDLKRKLKAELKRRKELKQNSDNYQVSSQEIKQQLQKAEVALNSFSNSTDNSPNSSSVLPVIGAVSVATILFGGLIIWKKNVKVKK